MAEGWRSIQSTAPVAIAIAIATQPTQFATPYQNTIVGTGWHRWLDPVNGSVKRAVAWPTQPTQFAVPASLTFVPQQAWQQPTPRPTPVARAWPTQATQFAVPASVPPPPQTPEQFGWYRPLSTSALVAKARPGNTFVPFDTVQIAPIVPSPQTVPLNYDAGSTQQRIVYYQSRFQVLGPVVAPTNTITGIAWQQPLGMPVPVAKIVPSWSFVPFNTVQINSITGTGWFQPFSNPAAVAKAQVGFTFVPFNTVQISPPIIVVQTDPFVKKRRDKQQQNRIRAELEIKYKRRLAIEEAIWPPTTYELPPYKLPENVKPAPDVSDLANVIMQVQAMRGKQRDMDDEEDLMKLLGEEYGIKDV